MTSGEIEEHNGYHFRNPSLDGIGLVFNLSETHSHCFFYESDFVFKFEHLVGWLVEDVDIAHPVHTLDLVVLVYRIKVLLVLCVYNSLDLSGEPIIHFF